MVRRYSFQESRFRRSTIQGFEWAEQGRLLLTGNRDRHLIFLPPLDSGSKNSRWGRFSLKTMLPKDAVCTVYAVAVNDRDLLPLSEQIPVNDKKKWMQQEGISAAGSRDILLYELSGQYLWCCIEVSATGKGWISEIFVEIPGDNFMAAFPEIYQDEAGFFHRYLSIFSTMYNEFQKQIDDTWRYLDLAEAPAPLLVLYAKWLGLSIESEILEEEILRRLVRNLYSLYQIKGTKKAIRELVKILLDKECIVVERNRLGSGLSAREAEIINSLYGRGMQDITLMINRKAEEKMQAQLMFFLNQFIPVRCRLNLVFYGECSNMDSYCYLDRNARLHITPKGSLDQNKVLDESVLAV